MAKWISSYRDLPLLLNQWANVVRWELRPRMFLRTTEFLWQEGHTAYADEAGAVAETMRALDEIYARTARELAAMPVIEGEKTATERFAGAVSTFSIEAMMRDGRALQAGTSHYLGTNFARAFNIQYTGEDGQLSHAHTTSFGMSTRMKLSPGFKFNDWELRGVPIRLELGPRDLAAGSAVMALRLGGVKEPISLEGAPARLADELAAFQDLLLERATEFRDSHTVTTDQWDDFTKAVATGWARALHCGTPECEELIKAETGATARCIPLDGEPASGRCIRCALPSAYGKRVIFGRAY
jgi:prolyl-tRNA synthetase